MLGRNWERRGGVGMGCCEFQMAIGISSMLD